MSREQEIIDKMVEECPFRGIKELHPCIKEAMRIHAEHYQDKHKEANGFIKDIAKLLECDEIGFDGVQWSVDDFKEAINEKSQQQAIAFAEWADENGYERRCFKTWSKDGYNEDDRISTADLYTLFLQQQIKEQ